MKEPPLPKSKVLFGRVNRREGVYARFYAWLYDRMLARVESAGLGAMRTQLLAGAEGRTVELGAGTGLNLAHYPAAISALVLTEPSPSMAARIHARLAGGAARPTTLLEAGGEALPLADGSVDTVVATLVLCTVGDPAAALREVRRVLRPGGRLLFLEHVRARDPRLARWQDRLDGPWSWLGNGCHCNRDTRAAIESAGLTITSIQERELRRVGALMRPAIVGVASRG